MLTKTQTRAAIEKVLRQVQAVSGRDCPDITDATKPIGDLDAFDSLMAVEATVLLEQELNVTLAEGTPFISTTGRKRALTVAEVVDCVVRMILPTRAA
jgi:acyl carrier protein